MAERIVDYPTLVSALEEYLARDDLQGYAPVFVQMAEGRFNAELKVVDMQKSTGALPLSNGAIDLPADFVDWVSTEWVPPASATGQRKLNPRYVEADSPEFRNRNRPNGPPQFYTLLANKVRLAPSAVGTLELVYYARLPPLTIAKPTNWLITKAPEVYLYGALLEAMLFQKDEARSAQWFGLLDKRLAAIFGQADTQKTGIRTTRAANDAAEANAAKATS